jgi:hypothetical protein
MRRRRADASALLAYALLALALTSRTWLGGSLGHRLVGGGGDPLGFTWFLAWLPHAVEHGRFPFATTLLMAPGGANLLDATAIPLPAALLWPVTALGGPALSYDVLATAALALSAWVAYLALLRVTPRRANAWVGGALYGFGSAMAGQATGHANLLVALLPPLAVLLLDDIRSRRRPLRAGALLGLCAAAQVFVDEEVLATTTLLAALFVLGAAWRLRDARERPFGVWVRAGAVAAGTFALLAGPALAYQLLGPRHVSGVVVSPGRYVADLAGFVVPSSTQLVSSHAMRHLAGTFTGQDGEHGPYLGLPLIALLAWAGWRLRRRALLPGLLLGVAALLSLGPHLHVLGHDTGILLPWVLPGHLPLIEDVVPDRFALFMWLAAAVLVVLLLDDLRARPLAGRRWLGGALVALALASVLPSRTPSERVSAPRVLTDARLLHAVAPDARSVLVAPYSNGQLAMYAQAASGFAYRIPDGGVFVPTRWGPAYGMRPGPLLYALAALAGRSSTRAGRTAADGRCLAQLQRHADLDDACRLRYREALRALRVGAVVLAHAGGSRAARRTERFLATLLGPPRRAGAARVFVIGAGAVAR